MQEALIARSPMERRSFGRHLGGRIGSRLAIYGGATAIVTVAHALLR